MRLGASAQVRIAGLAAACLAVTACSTAQPGPPTGAGVRGLFRAGGSSYPTGGGSWYSPAQAPHFSKTGTAAWHGQPARKRGVGAWFARVFKRGKAAAATPMPAAVIAADAPLAIPSIVTVTNLQTYVTVQVRVEQRAPLSGALISLHRDTAAALGLELGKPVQVRVRYAGPVVAYRERPDLRHALRKPGKRDVQLAAAAAAKPESTPTPAMPAPPPAPAAPIVVAAAETPVRLRPPIRLPTQLVSWRIQAGAFAERRNAERAVAMLKTAGPAALEVVQSGERTLYRVSLLAPADAGRAEALRQKVVKAGFADARLVRLS